MSYEVAALTDVGLKREINQDSILVDQDLGLFIVADGMGGHRGGEVASAMAIETVQDFFRQNEAELRSAPKRLIVEAYRRASGRIYHKGTVESPELLGMGTTMVLLLQVGKKIYIGNVGDSRAYLFREGNLWQLTDDHSLINEQLKAGVIKEEELDSVMGRNVITRSVGFERDVMPDILERDVVSGEIYLLCSDGLSGMVPANSIAKICHSLDLNQIAKDSINEAKRRGGDDNVSVIALKPKLG